MVHLASRLNTMATRRRIVKPKATTKALFHAKTTSKCMAISSCCCVLLTIFIMTNIHSTFAAQLSQIVTREHDHQLIDNLNNNQNQSKELRATYVGNQPTTKSSAIEVTTVLPAPINAVKSEVDNSPLIEDSIGDSDDSSDAKTDQINQDDNLDADNTTLIIDYDQQGYNLTTSRATPSAVDSSHVKQRAEPVVSKRQDETTVSASEPESMIRGEGVSVKSMVKDSIQQNDEDAVADASDNRPMTARLIPTMKEEDNHDIGAGQSGGILNKLADIEGESLRSKPDGMRDMRGIRLSDKMRMNTSEIISILLKKKPYSKYWTVEQRWDDLFKRFEAVQDAVKDIVIKNMLKDSEYYADLSVSPACAEDLKFIQSYAKKSTNFRWLLHMFDSTGKSEPGLLTGNMANLGHAIQCIKVRAPTRPSNHTFEERFFEQQTELLGERFRGKYCLVSTRPILPPKPRSVSRFSDIMNADLLSNISYVGLPSGKLKRLSDQTGVPNRELHQIDREHPRTDLIPFESELYQYLISNRNFMYTLPRFTGVCYPSSCTTEDVRISLQKTMDDQHQVVDLEFECEQEERSRWDWFTTPRLIAYVILALFCTASSVSSLTRYIVVDKLKIKRTDLAKDSWLGSSIGALDLMSMDKCAGNLFVKTNRASTIVNRDKIENNRSTSIDALKGFLILMLIYSELVHLGGLPILFMWSKWVDAMFPFYRSWFTQITLNTQIWTEAFYIISAYLIGLKLLENRRPKVGESKPQRTPDFFSFMSKRYIRLVMPMITFILLNYVWPRLSNGYVMQDQANKILKPCDDYGWTNILLFHNRFGLNETCLWPSHVSASFFQLHIISYPILLLMLMSLRTTVESVGLRKFISLCLTFMGLLLALTLALFGLFYPAYLASHHELIVPFLIDYVDYDNYQRVIEWMILPTYNHLTSYMVGLILAYMIVRKRMISELRRASGQDWYSTYMHRESSFDSVLSSSTQRLDSRPNSRDNVKPTSDPMGASISQDSEGDSEEQSTMSWLINCAINGLFFVLLLISLTASWFWNGFGQPMLNYQIFWYNLTMKLIFCISFGYIFYTHFATRRNSINPWMITRFLVPIGRMSLTIFYVSWIVIWFDLLSSLYQWHPSHYFISEKFHEIIFISLILGMLAYGAFEGVVRNVQLAGRRERLKRLVSSGLLSHSQGFEGMFIPGPDSINDETGKESKTTHDLQQERKLNAEGPQSPTYEAETSPEAAHQPSEYNRSRKRLSIADQYKLNAELRANYSFASIGLYESAGATGDLNNGSRQQSPEGMRKI